MTEERLSALLDGELPPAEAAEVAAALAADPALARRFAALARLKAVVAGLDGGIGAPAPPPPRRRPPFHRAAAPAAAVLAAGIAGLALLPPAAEAPAVAAHRRFAAAPAAEGGLSVEAGLADLAAAGLRLERVEAVAGGVYAGYRGPRGCRLGVWSGPEGALPARVPEGWRVRVVRRGGEALWIAAGPELDAGRFAALAQALAEENAATRLALLPRDAAPCRA